MKVHPLADRFPRIENEAFDDLVLSIQTDGLIEPIVTIRDTDPETGRKALMILDGRNRFAACQEAGVEPTFVKFEDIVSNGVPAWRFVIAKNVKRRHLTTEQAALLGASFRSEYEIGSGGDRRSEEFQTDEFDRLEGRWQDQAATDFGVGPTTLMQADRLHRAAAGEEVGERVLSRNEQEELAARIESVQHGGERVGISRLVRDFIDPEREVPPEPTNRDRRREALEWAAETLRSMPRMPLNAEERTLVDVLRNVLESLD